MFQWLTSFMYGRHGLDQLTIALFVLSMICTFLGRLFRVPVLSLLGVLLIAICLWRTLSKNTSARYRENSWFLNAWDTVKGWFTGAKSGAKKHQAKVEEHKKYKHFTCPQCGQKLRVPRGKGKIRVTCARCQTRFEAKS